MWDYRVFVENMYSLNVYTNIPRQATYITIKYGDCDESVSRGRMTGTKGRRTGTIGTKGRTEGTKERRDEGTRNPMDSSK